MRRSPAAYRHSRSRRARQRARGQARPGFLYITIAAAVLILLGGGLRLAVWQKPSEDTALTAPDTAGSGARNTAVTGQAPMKILAQGVDLTGLAPAQAREKLMAAHPWNLTVSYQDHTYPVPNPLVKEIDRIISALPASSQDTAAEMEYHFDYEAVGREIAAEADELAGRLNRKPVDSQLESYDRATGVYRYSKAESGLSLNREQLTADILEAARRQDYQAVITPVFNELPPARTQAQAKEQYTVIGTFTTRTTDNKNRNENIRLAVAAIDGRILKPGEEFSFNQATGNRTSEKGYQPAGAYKNGVLIEEPGGGVCQVSTTLYHAIINSGFMTTERNSHSFSPGYVEPGQDAMVSFDGYAGPDLKFVNTQSTNVALRAAFSNNQLKLSIVGLPVLEGGVTASIRSEKINEAAPMEPHYQDNAALAQGVEKEVEKGRNGTEWRSYLVLTKDGQILEEKPLHRSSYRGRAAVIQRGIAEGNAAAQEQAAGAGNAAGASSTGSAENASTDTADSASAAASSDTAGNTSAAASTDTAGNTSAAASTDTAGSASTAASTDTARNTSAPDTNTAIPVFPGASLSGSQAID